MRSWRRASEDTLCRKCGAQIAAGSPLQIITLPGVKRDRIRCESCAEEPSPKDLPQLPVRHCDTASGMTHIAKVAKALPFDWKTAQLGEDE